MSAHKLSREELLAKFGYPKPKSRKSTDRHERRAELLVARMDRELYIGGLRRVN